MLSWFTGRKAVAAAPTVRQSRDVIAELPQNNAVAAVGAVTEALAVINSSDALTLDKRYTEIQRLESAAVTHTHTLLREYLNTARQKKLREGELWNSAYECWSELATAYVGCVQRYAADIRSGMAFLPHAPVALARAVRALRRQLQWARIRYAEPSAELWAGLATLMVYADANAFDQPVEIYPGETTTVKGEFLKALMQAVLSCENLRPPAQDIASAVVSQFASKFVLSVTMDEGCTHWFDLNNPRAPARTTRKPPPDAKVRYFGAAAAVDALGDALSYLASSRQLPPGFALGVSADPAFVQSILEHVHQDWSGKTQARQHERRKLNTRITVVPGFEAILRTLEFSISDSLDFTDQRDAESWVVDDVSESGYGAVIPAVAGDWVEIGSLVGVEGDVAREWRVGVVRRVSREDEQQRVGIQLLGRNAFMVRLQRGEDGRAGLSEAPHESKQTLAIFLGTDASGNMGAGLKADMPVEALVSGGSFTSMESVLMLNADQRVVLRPKAVVERSAAFDRVTFTVASIEA